MLKLKQLINWSKVHIHTIYQVKSGIQDAYPSNSYSLFDTFKWFDWTSSGHQLYKHYTKRVDIALFSQLVGFHIFRIQVSGCPLDLSRNMGYIRTLWDKSSKPKICYFGSKFLCDENV